MPQSAKIEEIWESIKYGQVILKEGLMKYRGFRAKSIWKIPGLRMKHGCECRVHYQKHITSSLVRCSSSSARVVPLVSRSNDLPSSIHRVSSWAFKSSLESFRILFSYNSVCSVWNYTQSLELCCWQYWEKKLQLLQILYFETLVACNSSAYRTNCLHEIGPHGKVILQVIKLICLLNLPRYHIK